MFPPLDRDALQLALSGAFAGYLAPLLVGPEQRHPRYRESTGLDISRLTLVDSPDDPRAASDLAVQLAREGWVRALIRGSLAHEEPSPRSRPRTVVLRGGRRMSHATFLDLPGQSRFLLVADGQLNVAPNLAAKKDIVQNTLDLAVVLGVVAPQVALLAAKNTVAPAFPSTSEAAALRSMARQGAFEGAVIDGPLTPDAALSADAAHRHGVRSEIAGRADILIAPTMEAAVMAWCCVPPPASPAASPPASCWGQVFPSSCPTSRSDGRAHRVPRAGVPRGVRDGARFRGAARRG